MNIYCTKVAYFCQQKKKNQKEISMKREISMATANSNSESLEMIRNIKAWATAPAEWLRKYYSAMLEEEVSSHQASLLTQAQIALFLSVFATTNSFLPKAGFVAWLLVCIWKLKKLT